MPTKTKNLTLAVFLLGAALCGRARADEPASTAPAQTAKPASAEVTLKGTLGCAKCSFHEAKACENMLKVEVPGHPGKLESYVLADNAVSRANHEKVCGPASPATVTGAVKTSHGKKILTASSITFD